MKVFIVGDTGLLDGLALWSMADPGDVLLYVKVDDVPASISEEITRLVSIDEDLSIVIVGGTARVSEAVEDELELYAPTTRVAGPSRFLTTVAISEQIYPPAEPPVEPPAGMFIPKLEGPVLTHDGNPTVMGNITHDDGGTYDYENILVRGRVLARNGSIINIRNSELNGNLGEYSAAGWGGGIVNLERCEVWNAKDGMKDQVNTVQCTVHNLYYAPGAHGDAVQLQSSGAKALHRFSYFDGKWANGSMANAAFIIKNDLGNGDTQTCFVEDSYINGGNYTVFIKSGTAGPTALPGDVAFRRCKFGGEAKWGTRLSDGGPWDYRRNTNEDGTIDYSNLDYSLTSEGDYEWDVENIRT